MRTALLVHLQKLKMTLAVIGVMWVVLALCYVLPIRQFGIQPRSLGGLIGIVTGPFLHGSFQHLAANTPMLLVLGWLIQILEPRRAMLTIMGITLIAGLGTWLIGGGHENHIGASGVIYGLLGYTLALGYFNRKPAAVLTSLVMAALYGGALWGVLPASGPISWEGHLSGFVGGIVMAKVATSSP